jgi:hypothetical protein
MDTGSIWRLNSAGPNREAKVKRSRIALSVRACEYLASDRQQEAQVLRLEQQELSKLTYVFVSFRPAIPSLASFDAGHRLPRRL